MSAPSSSTRPVIQPWSDSSCIRFRVRKKVDLPHPDGPISACTRLGAKLSDTDFTAVNLPYMADSFSVTIRGRAVSGSGRVAGAARLKVSSAIEAEAAYGKASSQAQEENNQDQHQSGGPGVLMPLLVGAGRIVEHGERQGGHGLVQVIAQVLTAQRSEQKWGSLAGNTGDGQESASHDSRQCGANHHRKTGAPAGISQGQSSLTQRVGHQLDHLLR